MSIKRALGDIVGREFISDSPPTLEAYSRDLSLVPPQTPGYVVRPGNTGEVVRIVRLGLYNAFIHCQTPVSLLDPAFGPNHHRWMLKLKKALDPLNLSNRPFPHDVDEFIHRSPWMRECEAQNPDRKA